MEQTTDRYREIHRDCLLELNRTCVSLHFLMIYFAFKSVKSSLRSSLQRVELFGGHSSRDDGNKSESDMLLQEQNQLHSSIHMIDELIG
jgi:hypothetical protein